MPGNVGSCSELYLEKAFYKNGLRPKARLPVAKRLGEESLILPVHPKVTVNHIEKICQITKKIAVAAQR